MTFLGDLGGWLLAAAYDNRIPVAAIGVVGLVALLVAARRWRWMDRVRRHPVAATSAAILALVVLAPAAWYLLSPIVIRTELVEPPLAAAAATPAPGRTPVATPAAAASESSPRLASPVATPTLPTPTPWVAATPRAGTFSGTDDFHFGRGTATLAETAPGEWTIRLEDFSVRNGPDLYVYLSPARKTYTDGAIEVAKLKATDGSFNVRLPAGVDPADARSVLIWCKQFSHLFAYATLEA